MNASYFLGIERWDVSFLLFYFSPPNYASSCGFKKMGCGLIDYFVRLLVSMEKDLGNGKPPYNSVRYWYPIW